MGEAGLKKQILYPGLFIRIMATFMDLTIAMLVFKSLSNWIKMQYFLMKYGPLLAEHDIDYKNFETVLNFFLRPEIAQAITLEEKLTAFSIIMVCSLIVPLFCYLIPSWYFLSTSPAKYLLSMKIVDEETLGKPKLINLIWRFFGYSFFFIGIWFIFFTKKNQAFHDKLGKTIVISV